MGCGKAARVKRMRITFVDKAKSNARCLKDLKLGFDVRWAAQATNTVGLSPDFRAPQPHYANRHVNLLAAGPFLSDDV